VLKKLKEMIRQELSEYTYGSGDIVKDVNPTCPHYGAMGKVKSVNPRSVVFVVMNKGKNFKPGMELEKSHDQMKKMNENKVYKVGDTVSLLSFDRRNRGRAKVKGVTKSRPNKFGIKNHYITNKGTFTDMEVEGTEAFKLRFKGDTEKKVTKAMNSPYGVVLPEQSVRLNEMNYKQFVKYMNDFYGPKGVYPDKKKRTLGQKEINMAYSILLKQKPNFVIGFDSTDREMIRDILIKQRKLDPDYNKGQLTKDSVNEMSAKTKKIINKLNKKEKEMFMDMVDMLGFDQVMADYKRDKKAFKQALKDMTESVINESSLSKVSNGAEFSKKFLQGLDLVIKQAQNLKGALAKHPVKRDLNKLKAVQTLYKRFLQPEVDAYKFNLEAPDINSIKKNLANGRFGSVIEYNLKVAIEEGGFRGNSFYFLEDKTKKLRKKIEQALVGVYRKIGDAQLESVEEGFGGELKGKDKKKFEQERLENAEVLGYELTGVKDVNENINEDGHTDVASSKRKVMIMVDDANKLLNKLNGMNKEDSLPSWWSDKITLSQNYLEKATNYLLNPVESVNENLRPSDKKILMVIATEMVKTNMKGKNKNQIRKELPNILSTMGTNNLSKKSPTNRFNKNKMISLGKGFDKLSDSDKKVFINTLMYNVGLAESVNESKEPEVITQLRDIVKRQTNKKIKDPKTKKTMRVDMFTANVITQVYDAIKKNSSHRQKFESLPLDKMAQLSFKMMK
jgi:hypothetical protein